MTTPTRKEDLQCLIRDHLQLLVQTYATIASDRSKEDMVVDIKAMISDLLDPAITSSPNLVDSVKSFMDDIPNAIATYRQKLTDISPDREAPDCEAVGLYDSHAAGVSKQPLVPKEVADLMQRFAPVFKPELYPVQTSNQQHFTNAEDELLALGIKKFGTNWHEIHANMLPSKSEAEIKNRALSGAADNSIM